MNTIFKNLMIFIIDFIAYISICMSGLTIVLAMSGKANVATYIILSWIISILYMALGRFLFPRLQTTRLSILRSGWHHLLVFGAGCTTSLILYVYALFGSAEEIFGIPFTTKSVLLSLITVVISEAMMFWSGMLRIFFSSEQLAIKWRIIAIACGFIPLVNVIVLSKMMCIVGDEVQFENSRLKKQANRAGKDICKTKYPILMVHGIFFRDFDYLNYWGRIPKALEENGAQIFYGEHMSSASVDTCGKDLAQRIKEICEKTGSPKVNVIAHSKGGLDTRCAISKYGADEYVASLTTINTPHRGCEFAEYLLNKIPEAQKSAIARAYNSTFKRLGDEEPDFLEGVSDLTFSACSDFNEQTPDKENVYYQSVGSNQTHAISGRFPLNMSYALVKFFDGENDGLVGSKSFPWGDNYQYLTTKGRRGISHADMIDLNRENIKGFDVREFYIELVSKLKEKGF